MDKLVKKEASPLQRESQQTHMIHENFGFATTYHERLEERMSLLPQLAEEPNGMPATGTTFMGMVKPQRNW